MYLTLNSWSTIESYTTLSLGAGHCKKQTVMCFKTVFSPQIHLHFCCHAVSFLRGTSSQARSLGQMCGCERWGGGEERRESPAPNQWKGWWLLPDWVRCPKCLIVRCPDLQKAEGERQFVVVHLPFIVLHIHLMSTRWRCPLTEQHQGTSQHTGHRDLS